MTPLTLKVAIFNRSVAAHSDLREDIDDFTELVAHTEPANAPTAQTQRRGNAWTPAAKQPERDPIERFKETQREFIGVAYASTSTPLRRSAPARWARR